ncbi:CynX/NimT family MFS transporter [Terasakiella pusilla]|uniref:MFS transporter n=1 Tax=Terasakiella pusilla TaxID=64973 RepID=UPI00048ADD5B|nr:MFS transporter [Terasakiella pusilla]
MDSPLKTNWSVVGIAVLSGIVAALYVGKVPPALPFIRSDLNLTMVDGGYVISTFNMLGMAMAMLIGTMVDQLNRKLLIFFSFFCLSVGGLIGSLSESLTFLLFSRMIEGGGFICLAVAMPAIVIAASSEKDRSIAISLWSIFTPAGMALALICFPYLEDIFRWQGVWQLLSVLPLIMCGAVAAVFRQLPSPPPVGGNPLQLIGQTLSQKGLWLIALTFGGYTLQWVSLMVWLPTFLTGDLGYGQGTAALITAGVIAMNIPSNIIGGWCLKKGIDARYMILVGCGVMGVCVLGILLVPMDNLYRVIACFCFSLLGGLVPATMFAYTPRYAPSPGHMSASSGMLMQGSALGQFIGPPLLAGAVSLSGGDWVNALYPMLGGCLLSLVCGYYVIQGKRKG